MSDKPMAIIWVSLFIAVIFIVSAISFSMYKHNVNDNATMVEMVKNGASAIEARCAVIGNPFQSDVCSRLK